jgi:hypothetical protein
MKPAERLFSQPLSQMHSSKGSAEDPHYFVKNIGKLKWKKMLCGALILIVVGPLFTPSSL